MARKARDPWDVAVLVYERLCTFEFGIMVELFGRPRPEFDPWYRLRVCAQQRGWLNAAGGIRVEAPYTLRALDTAGTILIPGWRRPFDDVPPQLIKKLRRAHDEGARILSVCSGAFLLAETGLLQGRRATTHWLYSDELSERYPDLEVDPDVLYVDEGTIMTSAGSAAGLDMGLHLIRHDAGAAVANAVARRLVIAPHRSGGQQQFIETPVEDDPDDGAISQLLPALRKSLARAHTVDSMARRAKMSPRSLARRFKAATGTTPSAWLNRERAHAALQLLETTQLGLERIAERVGFGDAQLLRLHVRRVAGTTPTAYRRNYR